MSTSIIGGSADASLAMPVLHDPLAALEASVSAGKAANAVVGPEL